MRYVVGCLFVGASLMLCTACDFGKVKEEYTKSVQQAALESQEKIEELQRTTEKTQQTLEEVNSTAAEAKQKVSDTTEEMKKTAERTKRRVVVRVRKVARSMPRSQKEANQMVQQEGQGFFDWLREKISSLGGGDKDGLAGRKRGLAGRKRS